MYSLILSADKIHAIVDDYISRTDFPVDDPMSELVIFQKATGKTYRWIEYTRYVKFETEVELIEFKLRFGV
jgi:hypothetical protein